jgi:hypothetical protein
VGVDGDDILRVGPLSLQFGMFDTMAAPNSKANAANMLNMSVSIFLFVEFYSAFQKARTFTRGDALLQ